MDILGRLTSAVITDDTGSIQFFFDLFVHAGGRTLPVSGTSIIDWGLTQSQINAQVMSDLKGQIVEQTGLAIPANARFKILGV